MTTRYDQTIRKILRSNQMFLHDISYILKNEDNALYAIVFDRTEPDEIDAVMVNSDGTNTIDSVPDWDFNVDNYLLEYLENGYEIVYMNLDMHHNVWCAIDEIRDEVQFEDGLQKYLQFCQRNDITKTSIASLGLARVDITDLYVEKNNGYEIIDHMTVDNRTIVLAQSKTNPSPYVTWETNPNRSDGYRSGHYMIDLKDAKRDFEERSRSLFKSRMEKLPNHHIKRSEESR